MHKATSLYEGAITIQGLTRRLNVRVVRVCRGKPVSPLTVMCVPLTVVTCTCTSRFFFFFFF